MKVKLAQKPDSVYDLIAQEAERDMDEPMIGVVSEMATDVKQLRSFGFSEEITARGNQLAQDAGDEDPLFVIVRTEEGESRSGRLYPGNVLDSIAEQVNYKQPVGYLGHIRDEDLATALPEPQTTWFGAITRNEPSEDGKRSGERVKVIYTAGYLLPGAKIRTYIKTKAVNSTSWQGLASQTPIPGRGVKVTSIDLHSIDWSRKGAEGVQTARVVALAREMHSDNKSKGGKTKMDGEKDLSQVSPDEFKEANPNGFALLVREISQEKDGEIATLQQAVEAAKTDKTLLEEIRGVLKLSADDDVLAQIGKLVKKLGEKAKQSVEAALDVVLTEKVPDEETRKLIRRLVPVSEMEQKAADLSEDATAEDVDKLVREMVEASFDSDEVIKTYVSEMSPPVVRRAELLRGRGEKVDYDKLNMRRERVTMGGR